jgi:hypothetical protein
MTVVTGADSDSASRAKAVTIVQTWIIVAELTPAETQ